MSFERIIEQVYHKPWLITPTRHAAVRRLVESKLEGKDAQAEGFFDAFSVQRQDMRVDDSGIAHIQLLGVLGQGLSPIEKSCGATDTRDVRRELLDAMESPRVKGVLIDIDSPGGMVNGTAETARVVRMLRDEKPVVAYTDSLAASAAYWIGSQADEFYASESASLGSIGVYIPWVDDSAMLEAMGIKLEAIANEGATYKGLGFNSRLSDEQRELLQSQVDQMAADFQTAINPRGSQTSEFSGPRKIEPEIMRGQTTYGANAVNTGLVDGIRSRDSAMQRLMEMM